MHPADPAPRQTTAAVACMRNEAMFVVEWVAYHLAIGFDHVAVVTNDCTDGTDAIVAAMTADPRVLHIENQIAPGQAPQVAGMARVLAHPVLGQVDYLLHCDADEFLYVSCGDGQIGDLLALPGQADCIALAWRPFGDSGLTQWQGGEVLSSFLRADRKPRRATALHKCLFRPALFGTAIDHMPKQPAHPDVTLTNSRGDTLDTRSLFNPKHGRLQGIIPDQLTWENACIHHYAIRSHDVFLMKNRRGDGMALQTDKYFRGSTFWNRYNRNEVRAGDMRRHLPATRREMAGLRSHSDIPEREALALQQFCAARDATLTAETLDRWTAPGFHPAPTQDTAP